MMLRNLLICRQNDAEENAKRGAWQPFSFIFNPLNEVNTQRHCHQAAYISMLSYPLFCSYLALVLYISASDFKLMVWRLDTLRKESVDWKN